MRWSALIGLFFCDIVTNVFIGRILNFSLNKKNKDFN